MPTTKTPKATTSKTTPAKTKKASPRKAKPAQDDMAMALVKPAPDDTTTSPAAVEPAATAMSALDAAAQVLSEKGTALTCKELIGLMAAQGYWISPAGKTPHATLAAAIQREIAVKGTASRFTKAAPGRFALAR